MPDLEFYLGDRTNYWRVPLREKPLTLGRMQTIADIVTPPDDNSISRIHATLELKGEILHVVKNDQAKHPIYRLLADGREEPCDRFEIGPGESFRIGKTVFRYCPPVASENKEEFGSKTLPPPSEVAFTPEKVREFRFIDANQRVEALSQLPQLIMSTTNERMLEDQVLDTLIKGVPEADMVAVVRLDPSSTENDPKVQPLAVKTRSAGGMTGDSADHRVSRRLVYKAVRFFSATHNVWDTASADPRFTVAQGVDWALCVPVPDQRGNDLGFYVAGRNNTALSDANAKNKKYQGDVKFTQLAADIYAALRRVIELQKQQRTLSRFLPRPIIAHMTRNVGDFDKFLDARETDVTALFCDLRGSCRLASGEGKLGDLLKRLEDALGIMTDCIVSREGVIGDFQGDAAMAFWGWPRGDQQTKNAAQAALHIQKRFGDVARRSGHHLEGMACGVGIAHGRGIAGRLGTPDQFKIGAFGPAVNLAARLESLTKYFKVGILVDDATAKDIGPDPSWGRIRKLAKIKPVGFDVPVEVHELMATEADDPDCLPSFMCTRYERAVDEFIAGRWDATKNMLAALPGTDGPSQIMLNYIRERPEGPPPDWDGTMVMEKK